MVNKEKFQLVRRGVWPVKNDFVAENLSTSLNAFSWSALPLLMGYGSHSVEGPQLPPLDEDCTYYAKLFQSILEEELGNLDIYAWRASTTLDLGASGH